MTDQETYSAEDFNELLAMYRLASTTLNEFDDLLKLYHAANITFKIAGNKHLLQVEVEGVDYVWNAQPKSPLTLESIVDAMKYALEQVRKQQSRLVQDAVKRAELLKVKAE